MRTSIEVFRTLLDLMILAGAYFVFDTEFSRHRFSLRNYVWTALINEISGFAVPALLNWNRSVQLPSTILSFFVCLMLVYHQRGFSLLLSTLLLTSFIAIADLATGTLLSRIFGYEAAVQMSSSQTPMTYLMTSLCAGLIVVLTYLFVALRSLVQKPGTGHIGRYIRPVLMMMVLAYMFYTIMPSQWEDEERYFRYLLPLLLSTGILTAISATYVVQDIKYIRQQRLNSALLEDKRIQDALLKDTRVFRHNIANLLYGFRGTVSSGNREDIRSYYDHMVNTCALINNENILALQRIPSNALKVLLLEKIKRANDRDIPCYVYVDGDLVYRGWQDREMCEALGILMDNAIEAAEESRAPLVAVELHNAKSDMEVVVRNTYFPEASLSFAGTTKAGHEGVGLGRVRELTGRHGHSVFNIYQKGRFVEAHLLMGKSV